jgi:hypothetical protein
MTLVETVLRRRRGIKEKDGGSESISTFVIVTMNPRYHL